MASNLPGMGPEVTGEIQATGQLSLLQIQCSLPRYSLLYSVHYLMLFDHKSNNQANIFLTKETYFCYKKVFYFI